MPVWVPELEMLYVLVPRTGSSATRIYLMENYDAVDLRHEDAIEQGLVGGRNNLVKHSDLAQVRIDFRPPVRWSRIVKVASVRNPADSLFSSWWKHAVVYPEMMTAEAKLGAGDRRFLEDARTRRRIEQVSNLGFSEWVLRTVPQPGPSWRRLGSRIERDVRVWRANRRGHGTAPVPRGRLWYEGADVYLRFEHLNKDWRDECTRRGWKYGGEIPVFNETAGRPADYSEYLSPAAAAHLRRAFGRELRRFGYEIRSAGEA